MAKELRSIFYWVWVSSAVLMFLIIGETYLFAIFPAVILFGNLIRSARIWKRDWPSISKDSVFRFTVYVVIPITLVISVLAPIFTGNDVIQLFMFGLTLVYAIICFTFQLST